MNKSAELITDDSSSLLSFPHAHATGGMGAEAATRYLRSHASRGNREESLFQEVAGNALAAAFIFGIFLGRYVRQ